MKPHILLPTPLRAITVLVVLCAAMARPAAGDEALNIVIAIKDHKFVPSEVTAPAGRKLKFTVRNEDSATSEFESSDFHREKVVLAGGEITVYVGPLDAGNYEFFDDFHPQTRGHLLVK
jgi:plastocyanin